MKNLQNLSDGQIIDALVCFADIAGFTKVAVSMGEDDVVHFLKDIAQITTDVIEDSPGRILKYIGDATLIIFPDECVDEGVRTLLALKDKLEQFFTSKKLQLRVTYASHVGPVTCVYLPPFNSLDILGRTIGTTAKLERGNNGQFTISTQVFRKLQPNTRKHFHKFTPPVVYRAE